MSTSIDCGKEFSNWKDIANAYDINIYFCNLETPSQRPLNVHSNGLLRRNGLVKDMDFNTVSEAFVQSVANKSNQIPRKSLDFLTPVEVFFEETALWLREK